MSETAVESRLDGSEDDSCSEKVVNNENNDSDSMDGKGDEPPVKKAKATENSINDKKAAHDVGDTNSTPRGKRATKKRASAVTKTPKEDVSRKQENSGERRQTRSQTRGTTPAKPLNQKSPRQAGPKRAPKSRPRKEEKPEEEEEEEDDKETEKEKKHDKKSVNNNDSADNAVSEDTGEDEESQPEDDDKADDKD